MKPFLLTIFNTASTTTSHTSATISIAAIVIGIFTLSNIALFVAIMAGLVSIAASISTIRKNRTKNEQ